MVGLVVVGQALVVALPAVVVVGDGGNGVGGGVEIHGGGLRRGKRGGFFAVAGRFGGGNKTLELERRLMLGLFVLWAFRIGPYPWESGGPL